MPANTKTEYFSLCEQSHPVDNITCCDALSTENFEKAIKLIEEYRDNNVIIDYTPPVRIVPPELHWSETKYWIPYSNVVVLVEEEVLYKFSHKRQAYVRDKRQNVNMPVVYKI